jgi:hypothetical protein
VVERAVAAVLVLGLIGSYVALTAGCGGPGGDAEAARLYLVDDAQQTLLPVDAESLSDVTAASPVALDVPRPPYGAIWSGEPSADWTLSADGSTLAIFAYPYDADGATAEEMAFVIRDGIGGPERARFHPPAPVWNLFDLSADGSRILARRGVISVSSGRDFVARDPQEWYVFDTGSGRVLATIASTEPGPGPSGRQPSWLSPDGGRVYRLVLAKTPDGPGPYPLVIVSHDSTTGDELGRLELPDVRGGEWTSERRVGGRSVQESVSPALAFSPDGRTLAVVDAAGTSVTLIDAQRLSVERRVRLSPATDPAEAVARLPATPEAPYVADENVYREDRSLWAAYTADRSGLYVGGWESRVDDVGMQTCRALEMRRIDLDTGGIVGRASTILISPPLWIAPDGESVYSLDLTEQKCTYSPGEAWLMLRRLDAETFAPLAERELADYLGIELVPRLPNGR